MFSRFRILILFFAITISVPVGIGSAQEKEPLEGFSIALRVFFDYAYLLSQDSPMVEARGKGWNVFRFRRAYFTLDHRISKNFKVRFRTDADREADDKARVYIKNLYLEWAQLIPQAFFHIGMLSSPGKILSESVWGYRGIEKTLIHAFKEQTGQSVDFFPADLGLGLMGRIGEFVSYHAAVVNGSGFSHPAA